LLGERAATYELQSQCTEVVGRDGVDEDQLLLRRVLIRPIQVDLVAEAAQRGEPSDRDRLDARLPTHGLGHPTGVVQGPRVRVAETRQLHPHDRDTAWIEADIDGVQVVQGGEKEQRADEQRERYRDLQGGQGVPEPAGVWEAGAEATPEGAYHRRAHGQHGGRQTEPHADQEGESERGGQRPPVQGDVDHPDIRKREIRQDLPDGQTDTDTRQCAARGQDEAFRKPQLHEPAGTRAERLANRHVSAGR
jgi:hypothetical protein